MSAMKCRSLFFLKRINVFGRVDRSNGSLFLHNYRLWICLKPILESKHICLHVAYCASQSMWYAMLWSTLNALTFGYWRQFKVDFSQETRDQNLVENLTIFKSKLNASNASNFNPKLPLGCKRWLLRPRKRDKKTLILWETWVFNCSCQ